MGRIILAAVQQKHSFYCNLLFNELVKIYLLKTLHKVCNKTAFIFTKTTTIQSSINICLCLETKITCVNNFMLHCHQYNAIVATTRTFIHLGVAVSAGTNDEIVPVFDK